MADTGWNTIYCGPPPGPDILWQSWNLDPVLLGGLALTAWGLRSKWQGRLAVLVLLIAFVSPLCALSSALFSARVVHHVLLIAVAAPLIACALPGLRRAPPALPLAASTVSLWLWHLPWAYDLALSNVAVYWLMQTTLLGPAIWFWRAVFAPERPPIDAVSYIVLCYAQMGMLGAVLTFAPDPLYAAHVIAPLMWGMDPLSDQQLGGLVMWGPAGIAYAVAVAIVARSWWRGHARPDRGVGA